MIKREIIFRRCWACDAFFAWAENPKVNGRSLEARRLCSACVEARAGGLLAQYPPRAWEAGYWPLVCAMRQLAAIGRMEEASR